MYDGRTFRPGCDVASVVDISLSVNVGASQPPAAPVHGQLTRPKAAFSAAESEVMSVLDAVSQISATYCAAHAEHSAWPREQRSCVHEVVSRQMQQVICVSASECAKEMNAVGAVLCGFGTRRGRQIGRHLPRWGPGGRHARVPYLRGLNSLNRAPSLLKDTAASRRSAIRIPVK